MSIAERRRPVLSEPPVTKGLVMKSHGRSRIARLIVAGFALWQCGCAVARPTMVTPPSPEIGAQLGIVSVVSASDPLKTDLAGPTRGRGALRSALAGAGTGAKAGLLPGLAVMYISVPFMVIPPLGAMILAGGAALTAAGAITGAGLGAAGGALYGALAAEPASNEESAALRDALADSTLLETLRQRVEEVARERTRVTFAGISTQPAPTEAELDPAGLSGAPDTVLEVALQSLELKRSGDGSNAPLALVVIARGRLRRADGHVLGEHVATSPSDPRTIAEWTADNASQFRTDLAIATDRLAGQLVDVLLVPRSSEEVAEVEPSGATRDKP